MTTNYSLCYTQLDEKYNGFIHEIETALKRAAETLLYLSGKKSFRIELKEVCLLVGDYDPFLVAFPELYSIQIEKGDILLLVELQNDFKPMAELTGLTIPDKLAILNEIEDRIQLLK